MAHCACGSEKEYAACCGRFLDKHELPETPEELMRSRYTAYTLADIDYISRTMKSPAADDFNTSSAFAFAKRAHWLKLEIISASQGDEKGQVEFMAYFSMNNKSHIIHEKSDFQRIDGQWYYTHGEPPNLKTSPIPKIGRNEPCLCGSGKKYKKCCGVEVL